QVFIRLWAPDGRELMTSDLSSWSGLADPQEVLTKIDETDEPVLETLSLPQHEHNVRTVYGTIAPGVVLQIGESLEDDEEFIEDLLKGFVVALLAVIVLGGPIGWFMARRALRGVQEVTRAATEIADGALDRRVVVRSQSNELDTLAQTFNTMLDRIQALIIGMREMTDNLAHDLKSPLGRIRASAEMTLTSGGSKVESEAMAATTTEECDRLLEMINTTLDIAEAESGAAKLKRVDIDLVELVIDAVELFQPVAEDKQVSIITDLPDHCRIHGDRQRLQRVVANLLDNALKYMPTGGHVTIRLVDEGKEVKLSIEDTGIGVSAEESSRIFARFYRCDRSRSEHGNGLGLSLALAFVRAHGGDIAVDSNPGQGSTFTAVLPRSRHA
ncbi:MAG: HAMP domain-containing histidine kinase, partial [Gammaproteobacteria bacterium]|nr:HAMP domain-containing histidine kinase [Gammaproteobacteria bacterium]